MGQYAKKPAHPRRLLQSSFFQKYCRASHTVNFLFVASKLSRQGPKRFPIVFMLGKVRYFPFFSGVSVSQNICSLVTPSITGTSGQQYRFFDTSVIKLTSRRSALALCTTPMKNLSNTLLKAAATNWSWKVQNSRTVFMEKMEWSVQWKKHILATAATLTKAKGSACWKIASERAAYLHRVSQLRNYLTALPLYRGPDHKNKK